MNKPQEPILSHMDAREIYIWSENQEEEIDHILALNFIKQLRLLEEQNEKELIVIHQYTGGGEWYAGMAMFDAIKICKCPILFITYGFCASMGSIIPLAAKDDLILTAPTCYWMIHEGSFHNVNPAKEYTSQHKHNEDITKDMFEIYEAYTNIDKTTLKRWFNNRGDVFFDSERAVELGFAHGILDQSVSDIKKNYNKIKRKLNG